MHACGGFSNRSKSVADVSLPIVVSVGFPLDSVTSVVVASIETGVSVGSVVGIFADVVVTGVLVVISGTMYEMRDMKVDMLSWNGHPSMEAKCPDPIRGDLSYLLELVWPKY